MELDGFKRIATDILVPLNAADRQFLSIAEGSLVTGTILPSGAQVPSAPNNYEWTVRSGKIVLEKKK